MFKSYEYLFSVVEDTNRFVYDMEVIDDEFVQNTRVRSNVNHKTYLTMPIWAVIDVYESKKLPVAPNVARALCLMAYERANWNKLVDIVAENVKFNPQYQKYRNEVEKYLVLV